MKKLILGYAVITIMLIGFIEHYTPTIRHKCINGVKEDYSKVYIPIRFIPNQEKCISREENPDLEYKFMNYDYYKDLKEFIINKNNKYCLWNSRSWDDECQDSAMEYAFGNYERNDPESSQNYKKFKQAVIDFIKHIQANDIEKALTLTYEKTMFFTKDRANCIIGETDRFDNICRVFFDPNNKLNMNEGEINRDLFRENLMQIDADNIKFYLEDMTKTYMYSIIVPYKYQNIQKQFDIRFEFYGYGSNNRNEEYPRDYNSKPIIHDIGINNLLSLNSN